MENGHAELASASFRSAGTLAERESHHLEAAYAALLDLDVASRFPGRIPLAETVQRCDEARERLQGPDTKKLTTLMNLRIAHVDRDRGELEQAERRFRSSLASAKAAGDIAGMAESHTGLGLVATTRGDLTTAIVSLRRSLDLWARLARPADRALNLVHLAHVHTVRSEFVEARDSLAEAENILPAKERNSRSQVLVQKGWLDFIDQRPDSAITAYERALELLQPPRGSVDRGGILDRIASAEHAQQNLTRAEALYLEVLDIFRPLGGQSVAHVSFSLATVYQDLGELDKARPLLEAALHTFSTIGDDNAVAHVLASLGGLEHRAGNPSKAIYLLESAAQRFEERWQRALAQGDLTRPTAKVQDIEAELVDLLVERSELESSPTLAHRAFAYSDRARDRSLLTLIGARVGEEYDPSPEQVAGRASLSEEIEDLEDRRDTGEGGLEREIRQLQNDLDTLERDIRSANSEDAVGTEPIAVNQLQRALPLGTCVLSYVLGEERSFVFVVCPDRFRIETLPTAKVLLAQAQAVVAATSSSDERGVEDQAELLLQVAANTLLSPIAADLEGFARLIVVVEGQLARIPFGALPDPRNNAPLLSGIDIVQVPSVGVYLALRHRDDLRPKRDGPIMVFADPVYSELDSRVGTKKRSTLAPKVKPRFWPRLPATGEEALAIRTAAPDRTRVHLGFDARLEESKYSDLANASIVHFATHGDLDEEVPSSSGLVLARLDEHGVPRPSYLRIRDIRALELNSDLVVLSACHSAWDKTVRGDVLMGLAQAFFVAGASRVLVTLWPVDDEAAAVLMAAFYRYLLIDGSAPETALRRAQMDILSSSEWHAPFYWAGFVLLGG
ncbi:MAG: CHAT domain-containing protein [Thermoanaerobaculia bacterium]|nr:CHAT domain-containing protein [Thermoanaerobaculia bacterium]